MRRRGTHGWREIDDAAKRRLIDAIASGKAPDGPLHLELDICDRCNVDCYFCNAMDVRTKEQVPCDRVAEILDEAVPNGLRSVRLAGGGDPLFHREIERVIDTIHERGVVIDNITSNCVGLSAGVAERLVRGETREIVASLNAGDAADYARMMQVKPAMFDKVIGNLEQLVSIRGEGAFPCLVVQFLLDRTNYTQAPEMYRLARRIGADAISVNIVLEIPRDRVDPSVVFHAGDVELLRPVLREIIEADRDAQLLELFFEFEPFNTMVRELQQEAGVEARNPFPTAPSFQERNGHCFFGFYSGVVRGNGDMYPCCMLMSPDYKPIGNAMTGSFAQEWKESEGFTTLRHEMREVMLAGEHAEFQEDRFKTIRHQCVNFYSCGLKNMYFRGDEAFYRELGEAIETSRRREIRFLGNRQQFARAVRRAKVRHPRLRRMYEKLAFANPSFRRTVRGLFGTAD